ncbi:MAG: GntR family transcriptional regulator [Kordiimonadaceae bacterium]|nr:GntR family transcriptional regulator [Kordiimonadaceae bacterium]MBO6568595.1 GntR family transcriptional regulator [Kordiimonadaceae bacterium]MBO6965429.1 GntR family transcriptional regulator [Kordiimonadaceae bacterium]
MLTTDTQASDAADTYEAIMDAIVTQKLAPSQKVSENILSDMFDIGRATARNLIERLLAKQFLVSVSPRVTLVAPLTLLDIKQNFTLRKLLLPTIISMATPKVDHASLAKLNEAIGKMQPVERDEDALQLLKMNKKMNLVLVEAAGYPLMLEWAHQLEDTAMRIYWLYLKTEKRLPYSTDQQGLTFDIVKSDEPTRLKAVIETMLVQTEERILSTVFANEQFYSQDLKV